jgi:hypothetical protein
MSLRVVRCVAARHEMDHTAFELRGRSGPAGAPGERGYRRGTAVTGRARHDRGAPLSEPSGPPDDAAVAPATSARRPRTRLLLLLASAVFLADLASKLLVVATIDRGENIRLLGGALYLTHARNTGAAFSFAEGFTVVFTLIAAAVAVVIVRLPDLQRGRLRDRLRRRPRRPAGAARDRVRRLARRGPCRALKKDPPNHSRARGGTLQGAAPRACEGWEGGGLPLSRWTT